jgi:hypothetical protein
MKIRMLVEGCVVATATLYDNQCAKDFSALLPLHLALEDYAASEKIADLPRKLTTEGASASYTPTAGDICFYAPWGNLAIFYADGELSDGLVLLGRIDSGLDNMRKAIGRVTVEETVGDEDGLVTFPSSPAKAIQGRPTRRFAEYRLVAATMAEPEPIKRFDCASPFPWRAGT